MRISELCGLTIADLDFDRRRIRVDHQLVRTQDGKRYNGNPKVAMHVQKVVQRLCEKYNEENIIPLPRITPHGRVIIRTS